MSLSVEQKKKIVDEFKSGEKDTGSSAVQVALLTTKIKELTEHLKLHQTDHNSRRGLLKMVGQRKRHLTYIREHNSADYESLIKKLGIRR